MRNILTPLEELERQLKSLTATSMGRRAFLAAAPMLLAACATAEHRQREGNVAGEQIPLSIADEQKMAQGVLPEMKKDYPTLPDPEVQNYIHHLGAKIATSNGLEGHPYHYNFTVVGVPQVNAFALPAGTIFVTAPLIAVAQSEAELAGVVGHEIGHVKARHVAQRIAKENQEKKNSWLYGAGGGILGGALGFGMGELFCGGNKGCLAAATAAGVAAGVGGALLIQKYRFMANSREDEMEADRIAFRTSVASNYDKNRVGDFYSRLLAMDQESKAHRTPLLSGLSDAMATHPPSEERVEQMKELAAAAPTKSHAVVDTKEFDKVRRICQDWVNANHAQGAPAGQV